MKKVNFLFAAFALLGGALSSCGSSTAKNADSTAAEANDAQNPKAIVCFFTATGTTQEAATRLAELVGNADLYEIEPAAAYSSEDLDWRNKQSRSSLEMADKTARPEIVKNDPQMQQYEVVYLGCPNWWDTAPRVVNTFLDMYGEELKGKPVKLFMTSGGSSIDNTQKDLKEAYPEINWQPGMLMNDVTDAQINAWIAQ